MYQKKGDIHKNDLKHYRKFAINAAKELLYGPEVIARIKTAKNEDEISEIMREERSK